MNFKDISKSKKVLLLMPDELDSQKYVMSFIKNLKSTDKVCYVTLYKSRNFLVNDLKINKIDLGRFYFVDTVSSYIKEPKPVKNTYFVPAPYDLGGIGKGVIGAIEEGYNVVIFDSLSALLNYGLFIPAGTGLLMNFIKSISNVLKKRDGKIIFFGYRKNKENLLVEETLPAFDQVIEIK